MVYIPQLHTIEQSLLERYGPLLSISQLAEVLHRSPDGLRIALRSSQSYALEIQNARIKIGRRIYFRSTDIACYLAGTGA